MKTINKTNEECVGLNHHIWGQDEDPITYVAFNRFDVLTCNKPHLSMITVLTSNGETGTMTHLHRESDLNAFITKLSELHEKKPHVNLVGNFNNKSMKEFHPTLRNALQNAGYAIHLEHSIEPSRNTCVSLYANKTTISQPSEVASPTPEESEEKKINNKLLRRVSTSDLFIFPAVESKTELVTEIPFPIVVSYQRARSGSASPIPPASPIRSRAPSVNTLTQ
jgi:hypothetical protein